MCKHDFDFLCSLFMSLYPLYPFYIFLSWVWVCFVYKAFTLTWITDIIGISLNLNWLSLLSVVCLTLCLAYIMTTAKYPLCCIHYDASFCALWLILQRDAILSFISVIASVVISFICRIALVLVQTLAFCFLHQVI